MVYVIQIIHIAVNLQVAPPIKILLCVQVVYVLNLLKIVNNPHINVLYLNTKDVLMDYVEKIVPKFILTDVTRKIPIIVLQVNA